MQTDASPSDRASAAGQTKSQIPSVDEAVTSPPAGQDHGQRQDHVADQRGYAKSAKRKADEDPEPDLDPYDDPEES